MNREKTKKSLILIFIIAAACTLYSFFGYSNEIFDNQSIFYYYAIDSNILLGISSLLLVIVLSYNLLHKKYSIPKFVFIFKYITTVSVVLTFLVVLFYLVYVLGFNAMYTGINFFLHLVTPILAFISFTFYEYYKKFKYIYFINFIPSILYLIYVIPKIVNGLNPPYPFLDIKNGSLQQIVLSFFVVLICIHVIGVILIKCNRLMTKNTNKKMIR